EPDPLVCPSPLPDGQGPPHGIRDRQHRRRPERLADAFHRGLPHGRPQGDAEGRSRLPVAFPMGWMEELERKLASRPLIEPEPAAAARRAGVLVPLFVREARLWIVFTRRTDTLEHHRGQISFPGGAEEPEDEDL